MTHVSIVLLHYNTPKETRACLASLRAVKKKGFALSIIVVDNASHPRFELKSAEQSPEVTIIRSDSNLGFTGGNNLGIQQAIERFDSDYVCLLNSDTRVDSYFVHKLLQFLSINSKVGAVCPLVYFEKNSEYHKNSYASNEKGSIIWYSGGAIDWRNLIAFHKHVDEVNRSHISNSIDEDYLTGCCMLIRREVLEKVHGFDDRFFLYFEDVDLSQRIKAAGYTLGMCSESYVWHLNAGSSGGAGSKLHQYYQTRNRLLFFWSSGSLRTKLTVLRWALQLLFTGTTTEQRAIKDALLSKYGKETAI